MCTMSLQLPASISTQYSPSILSKFQRNLPRLSSDAHQRNLSSPQHSKHHAAHRQQQQKQQQQRCGVALNAVSTSSTATDNTAVDQAKDALLLAVAGTDRGSDASSMKRGEVEEAQVTVESFSPAEADWRLLEGDWNVVYTTAGDVLPLVRPNNVSLPLGVPFPLQVGRVGQRFTGPDVGRVQNIIEIESFLPLVEGSKATLIVEASYEVRTARSIALRFEKAGIGEVRLSDGAQNLLAPPILPRGFWNLQALMAVKEFSAFIPLSTRVPGVSSDSRQPVGINYCITYLDYDMLIGRAQGNGGTFIFVKQPLSD